MQLTRRATLSAVVSSWSRSISALKFAGLYITQRTTRVQDLDRQGFRCLNVACMYSRLSRSSDRILFRFRDAGSNKAVRFDCVLPSRQTLHSCFAFLRNIVWCRDVSTASGTTCSTSPFHDMMYQFPRFIERSRKHGCLSLLLFAYEH